MESPKTPSEALDRAIARAVWTGGTRRKPGRPGEIIEGMSEETRALLKNLRSDDIGPGSVPDHAAWLGSESDQQRMCRLIQDEKLKFDRQKLRLN